MWPSLKYIRPEIPTDCQRGLRLTIQKPALPSGVYVLTLLATIVGIGLVEGGARLISTAANSGTLFLAFIGSATLVVGGLAILCGIGFLGAKRWSWSLGIAVSILAAMASALEIAVQGTLPPIGVEVSPLTFVWIIFPLIMIYYLNTTNIKTYLFFSKNIQG